MLASLGIDADTDPAIEHHDDHYYWMNAKEEMLLDIDWFSKAEDGWRSMPSPTFWSALISSWRPQPKARRICASASTG